MTSRERAERFLRQLLHYDDSEAGRKRLDFDAEGLTAEFEAVREETAREIAAWLRHPMQGPAALGVKHWGVDYAAAIERGDWKRGGE